jgi:hypothetical protein
MIKAGFKPTFQVFWRFKTERAHLRVRGHVLVCLKYFSCICLSFSIIGRNAAYCCNVFECSFLEQKMNNAEIVTC